MIKIIMSNPNLNEKEDLYEVIRKYLEVLL